jgi:hypothetical protein
MQSNACKRFRFKGFPEMVPEVAKDVGEIVEAFRWKVDPLPSWLQPWMSHYPTYEPLAGDWVFRHPGGGVEECEPQIFKEWYEEVTVTEQDWIEYAEAFFKAFPKLRATYSLPQMVEEVKRFGEAGVLAHQEGKAAEAAARAAGVDL